MSSSQSGLWDPLPWLAVGMLLTHLNSTSALHYLQFILWFSKLAVSKLHLDDTVYNCQHCLSSDRPLAAQLVSLQVISFSLAPTQWMCSFTPSQTCLVPVRFGISVPSQPCHILYMLLMLNCTDNNSVSLPWNTPFCYSWVLHSALHLILVKTNTLSVIAKENGFYSHDLIALITHLCALKRTRLRFRCCGNCSSPLQHFTIQWKQEFPGVWHQQGHTLTTQDSNCPLIKSHCFIFHSYRPFPYHPAIIHCPIKASYNSSLPSFTRYK